MANLLGYEIAESMTQRQAQLMMTQILCSSKKMKAILELDESCDEYDDQQLRRDVLQAFRDQLQGNLSGLSKNTLSIMSTEVDRLTSVFSLSKSSQTLHGHSHHQCNCEDFTSALKAKNK